MLKKGVLFCIASYLVARFEWALEVSRLAVFTLRPKPRVVQISRNERILDSGVWVFAGRRDYFLTVEPPDTIPVFHELPERLES